LLLSSLTIFVIDIGTYRNYFNLNITFKTLILIIKVKYQNNERIQKYI
jgi:hypothetical protein